MIRYKVINTKTKTSIFYSTNKEDETLRLTYNKGEIIKSNPNTFGIFTFKTKKDAERFCQQREEEYQDTDTIIKVNSIGRGKKIKFICGPPNLTRFYEILKTDKNNIPLKYQTDLAPEGTICYQSVQVLE